MSSDIQKNMRYWSVASPGDYGNPVFQSSNTLDRLDPVAAAALQLAGDLQTALNTILFNQNGLPANTVPVMVGWPSGQDDKPPAVAQVVVVAAPSVVTQVVTAAVPGSLLGLYRHADWQSTFTVTLLCDHKDFRDMIAEVIHGIVDNPTPFGPRGLYTESARYFNRPTRYFLRATDGTINQTDADILGEWRQSWSLEAHSDIVKSFTFPDLATYGITIEASLQSDFSDPIILPTP